MKPGSDKRLLGSACALAVIVASCVWLGAPLLRLGRGRSLGASQLQPTVHTLQRARNTQHIAYQPAASGTDDTSAPFSPAARRLFGPPQPAVWLDEQTPAFEPAAYAAHYGDMFNMTDEDLANHFRSAGRGERRVPQRMRLILSYEAASGQDTWVLFGGLCNQIYSHIGMLALTVELGAEAVLPDAVHRGGRGFQDNWRAGEIQPLRTPMSTLFDVEHLTAWAKQRQTVLHKTEPVVSGPVMEVTVSGSDICCRQPMAHLVAVVRDTVLRAAGDYMGNHPGKPLPVARLFLRPPRLLFALEPDRHSRWLLRLAVPLIEDVARNLSPAPHIRELADRIVAKLSPFDAVHLRLEDDARYQDHMGGQEAVWQAYFESMRNAKFDNSTTLYVASGLLTYMNASDFGLEIGSRLVNEGVCSAIVTKEDVASPAEIQKGTGGLSEALALLDFTVLTRARQFVGFGLSSFSWGVQEYRCLLGLPLKSTTMPAISIPAWNAMGLSGVTVLSDHDVACPDAEPAVQV